MRVLAISPLLAIESPVAQWVLDISPLLAIESPVAQWVLDISPLLATESPVAQWLEHPTRSRRVVGSNPIWG